MNRLFYWQNTTHRKDSNVNQSDTQLKYFELFGKMPDVTQSAPGRLEVLGNHTDYNEGYVLSMAVDQYTTICLSANETDVCQLRAEIDDFSEHSLALSSIESKGTGPKWTEYIRGILVEFRNRNIKVPAFDLVIRSTIPLSAGMSSSAALEVALTLSISELTNHKFSPLEIAQIGQACENNTIGANTGLLDQLTCYCSLPNKLLLSEYREHTLEHVPFPENLAFVVVNTGVKHDLSAEYNTRRKSCEEVASALNVSALRDVSMKELRAAREEVSKIEYKRALHVVTENERVHEAAELLQIGNFEVFGELLFESHDSSRENFENSCPELDALIQAAHQSTICYGARLSGGGFGGISIHLVEQDYADDYIKEIKEAVCCDFADQLEFFTCTPAAGAMTAKLFSA